MGGALDPMGVENDFNWIVPNAETRPFGRLKKDVRTARILRRKILTIIRSCIRSKEKIEDVPSIGPAKELPSASCH